MMEKQSSITASGIAVVRAVESEKAEGVRICYDPYAAKFLNPWFYRFTRFFINTGYAEWTGAGVQGFLAARCRYMDDVLLASIAEGLQQLVILGAGYDSRAYRFEQLKLGVRVFEVDHPATQQVKMKKVKSVMGELPGYVSYVGVDFNRERLEERLPASGYDEHQKTLFILEGVVMYLTPEAVDGTHSFIAHHADPGSQVVFDYIYSDLMDGSVRHGEVSRMRRVRRFSGEGLTFSIAEGKAIEFMEQRGFVDVKDVSGADLHKRYFSGPNARRKVAWGYGIVLAEVS